MYALVFLVSLLSPDRDIIIKDRCDFIEVNHVYRLDHQTKRYEKTMVQLIWWEWKNHLLVPEINPITGQELDSLTLGSGFVVRDYLITWSSSSRPQEVSSAMPTMRKKKWVCLFYDKDDKVFREVVANWIRETHTDYDVEIKNREVLSLPLRNKLKNK